MHGTGRFIGLALALCSAQPLGARAAAIGADESVNASAASETDNQPAPGDAATAPKPDISRIVVFRLKAAGIDGSLAESLSRLYTFVIHKALPNAKVLDQTDIDNVLVLAENQQLMGCESSACLAEIGGALGADHLATGSVGKVGSRYIVDLRLIEAARVETVRHLSEQVTGDEDRLAEVINQLGAHLIDPASPVGAGVLEIWGTGEVSVDGTTVGPAPVSSHRVAPGEHIVRWRLEGDAVATGERRVTVEPFARVRVEPEERVAGLDLGGFYGMFGVGNSPRIRARKTETGRAGSFRSQFGWAFASGLTLHLGRSFQMAESLKREGGEEVDLATDVGTVGVGYQTQGRWRLHTALDLGGGRIYSPEDGFQPLAALAVQPSVTATYSFARYFQVGLAAVGNGIFAEDFNVLSASILLVVGIPSRGQEHYPQRDFYKSPWFWGVALSMAAGSAMINVMADQVGVLAIQDE